MYNVHNIIMQFSLHHYSRNTPQRVTNWHPLPPRIDKYECLLQQNQSDIHAFWQHFVVIPRPFAGRTTAIADVVAKPALPDMPHQRYEIVRHPLAWNPTSIEANKSVARILPGRASAAQ